MTLSELAGTVAPESASEATGEWTIPAMTTALPVFPQNKITSRLEAKNKMRLSVQMARVRAKLPPSERPPVVIAASVKKTEQSAAASVATASDITPARILTPPPPCSAFSPSHNRELILNLICEMDDEAECWKEMPSKTRKGHKLITGWDSASALFTRKLSQTAAENSNNNRQINTRNAQRRSTISSGNDAKLKINLYDRYNVIAVPDTFKFFHYTDLRLYIKQYRRNHSSCIGQQNSGSSVLPAYEYGLYRFDDSAARTRSMQCPQRSKDGFVLGVQSTPVTPSIWKANLPLYTAHRQKFVKEKQKQAEEPILTPRVFVRQNGAFSHLWKTKEDGTPDPSIAVTRPPTTARSQRPTCSNESNKENQISKAVPMTSSPELESSHGDLLRETSAWRIMQMIATCSLHSRTDGSSSTTTNECKSRLSDTVLSQDPEKSLGTGETISSSSTPEDKLLMETHESQLEKLKTKYSVIGNALSNERQFVYNRTRSILSNMSNLLNHCVVSENMEDTYADVGRKQENLSEANFKILVDKAKDVSQRNNLVNLRKELRNLASRRTPSRQKLPSPSELSKTGSLVLPSNKTHDFHRTARCSTTPHKLRKSIREIRKIAPSPAKLGHAGYKRIVQDDEPSDRNSPILFVSRSHLLPSVAATVAAMKSKQMMLHDRNAQPSDFKQFTKITDLLRHTPAEVPSSTRDGGLLPRRVALRTQSVSESRTK